MKKENINITQLGNKLVEGLNDLDKEKVAYRLSVGAPVNHSFRNYGGHYNVRDEYDEYHPGFATLKSYYLNNFNNYVCALFVKWCHKHQNQNFKKFRREILNNYLFSYKENGHRVKGHPGWFQRWGVLFI